MFAVRIRVFDFVCIDSIVFSLSKLRSQTIPLPFSIDVWCPQESDDDKDNAMPIADGDEQEADGGDEGSDGRAADDPSSDETSASDDDDGADGSKAVSENVEIINDDDGSQAGTDVDMSSKESEASEHEMMHWCEPPPGFYDDMPDNQLDYFPPSFNPEFFPMEAMEETEGGAGELESTASKPMTAEEKRVQFWKKYLVPFPRPQEKNLPDNKEDHLPDENVEDKKTDLPKEDKTAIELDSSYTLKSSPHPTRLRPKIPKDESSDSDSSESSESDDSSSESPSDGSVVDQATWESSMQVAATKAHTAAVASSSSTTLETPRCSKPEP